MTRCAFVSSPRSFPGFLPPLSRLPSRGRHDDKTLNLCVPLPFPLHPPAPSRYDRTTRR